MDQLAMFPGLEPASGTQRWIGRCVRLDCRRTVAVESDARSAELMHPCPEGHGPILLRRVTGTLSACPCDPRCTGAQGPQCSCSCGGKNHGRGWTL